MKPAHGRNALDLEPFSYRKGKDGKVALSWENRQVKLIKGRVAETFLAAVAAADRDEAQRLMAKLTGNFKRGNERRKNPFKKGRR